jgi:hypothetical protein
MAISIKKTDASGRVGLGKAYANSPVQIDDTNPDNIIITPVEIIPKSMASKTVTLTQESFIELINYMENPPEETDKFLAAKEKFKKLGLK